MKWNILLMWPSWAWKTTISKEIIRNTESHKLFTADTSRNIREWEQNWVDYNFISSYKIIKNSNLHQNYLTVNI
jgi:guanylate kinase